MTLTTESMKELENMTVVSADLTLRLKCEALEVELEQYKKWLTEEMGEKVELRDENYRICAENAVLLNENDYLRAELRKQLGEEDNYDL